MSGKPTKTAHSEALAQVRAAMSPELLGQLQAVATLPDEQIDTADIPEVRDWSGAVRGRYHEPPKQRLTLQIDADVIDYFRKQAPRGQYQAAMYRALRATMLRAMRRGKAADDGQADQAKG